MAGDADRPDPLGARLAAAKAPQDDPIGRGIEARVRKALLDEDSPPPAIGRFRIDARLGSGGMGVVYAAHDPTLDRPVALKVLHATGDAARKRVLHEARALARLSHENVIGVYEAEALGDDVYIAMERVDGASLRDYLRAESRGVAAIVRLFAQAGSGLAAAHAAGMVHGDFKPENALVDASGRVKVVDFGLARAGDGPADGGDAPAADPTVSRTGSLAGTPAYMAPEQLAGEPVGAAADQFALCVALWEAVHGQRPFAGDTAAELGRCVRAGELREPRRRGAAPAWLDRALRRGLRVDPGERFSSMTALVDELTADRGARRRRWLAAAAGAALLAAGGAIAVAVVGRGGASPCDAGPSRFAEVWNGERANAVRASFGATGRTHAANVADRVIAELDAYGASWTAMHRDACEATHVRREQSGAALDLRMRCLDRRRGEVRALVDLVTGDVDPTALGDAVTAVYALPDVAACADVDALAELVPPPEDAELRARVDALRARLDEIDALRKLGRVDKALELARAADGDAAPMPYAPVRAEAAYRLSQSLLDAGDAAAAEDALRRAVEAGTAARDDALVARSWIDLIYAVGYDGARTDEGLALAERAELALTRAGNDDVLRAALASHLGSVLQRAGRFDEALARYEQALALRDRALAPGDPVHGLTRLNIGTIHWALGDTVTARARFESARDALIASLGAEHPAVAMALNNIALTYEDEGKYADAQRVHREALAVRIAALGDGHPDTAGSLLNLGSVLEAEGDLDAARDHYRRALAAFEAAYGAADHPDIALAMNNVANAAQSAGELSEARKLHEAALAMRTRLHGPDHPDVGMSAENLGNVARSERNFDEAIELHERAVAITVAAFGAEHPDAGSTEYNLGATLRAAGRCGDARAHFERSVAGFAQLEGDPMVAYPLTGLGECALDEGRPARAIEPLERALALRAAAETPAAVTAGTQFALARALWPPRRDRDRATHLAADARAAYAAAGDRYADELAAVDAWAAATGVAVSQTY
jgi:tetratricopeptide (TPR) repeat protein/predicted Ser/Thr protein kinase